MGSPDSGAVEINTDIGRCDDYDESVCGCVAGFRRCDTCEERCPFGFGCGSVRQVCRARELDGPPSFSDGCRFRVDRSASSAFVPGGTYCSTGMPCVVLEGSDGTEENEFSGSCMPIEYCLAAPEADPPLSAPVKCVYADGTPLLTGPPPGECPVDDAHPRAPFCGGACGRSRLCPWYEVSLLEQGYGACVGLSDDRSFGVCGFSRRRCVPDPPEVTGAESIGVYDANDLLLLTCELEMEEPCVCMKTLPVPDPPAVEHGFAVPASACRTYAAHHPGLVECLDADWNPIE
jgi:hypothetical protein